MIKKLICTIACISVLFSCKKELTSENPKPMDGETGATVRIEDNTYSILDISKNKFSENGDSITYKVMEAPDSASYRVSINGAQCLFATATSGHYFIELKQGDKVRHAILTINPKEVNQYISDVFDYRPAPGQFVNKLPKYETGDTQEKMNTKVKKAIAGNNSDLITLGGWGGYVVFGFDHPIVNVKGRADFAIDGNAFFTARNSEPIFNIGNSEPGVIMVSYDENHNGKPDDKWYEILGSGSITAKNEPWYNYLKEKGDKDLDVYRDYMVTYYKPKELTTDPIKWIDNKGNTSYLPRNSYHSQPYYPLWINTGELVFRGVRLANNSFNDLGTIFKAVYSYGYADNITNNNIRNDIDIDWAIDSNGNKANLVAINFVKVYTGVNSYDGAIGEASTEIQKGEDLHVSNVWVKTDSIMNKTNNGI